MFLRLVLTAALVLSADAVFAQQEVAVQQDNLMRSISKTFYGVLSRTARGQKPYDQAAIQAALTDLNTDVGKIADVFKVNPKESVANDEYGSSQKIWQNKADFDSKIPAVQKALTDAKSSVKDVASLKAAFTEIDNRCNVCHDTYRVKLK